MNSIFEYLIEATLEQTKDVLKKADWSREKTDALYPKLFNSKKFKTDSRHYRIYLPFEFDQKIPENFLYWDGTDDFEKFYYEVTEMFDVDTSTMRDVFDNFRQYADEDEYSMDRFDYQNGYVFDKRGRPVKIVKVFNELIKKHPTELKAELEPLIKRFNEDRLRDGNTKINFDKLMIVISKNPLDILNQSTDRKWTSCMDLTHGVNKDYVAEDLRYGTIVAYLTENTDTNLQNPIARLSIKPYVGAFKGKVLLNVGRTAYNVLYGNFVDDLLIQFYNITEEFIDENFNSKKVKDLTTDVYLPHKKLYKDEPDPSEINRGGIDTEEKMMKKIRPYGGDLVWEALHGNWIFVTRNNRYGIINIKGDIILPPKYSEIEQADDQDLKLVKVYYGTRIGLYNIATEDYIIDPYSSKIESMSDFYYHEGYQYVREELNGKVLADVEFRDGTSNYIDKSGKLFYQKNRN